MRRFAASLIERLQWTRLQLLDIYGSRTPLSCRPADGAGVVKRTAAETPRHVDARARAGLGRAAARSHPGQFTMLYAFGAGEVPISISGDGGEREALVHTVRAVGLT